jgi:tetratricopeptide (TPR) repeat protein
MLRIGLVSLWMLLWLAAPSAAAEDTRNAKEAYHDGLKHYDLNEYQEAIVAFKRAYWLTEDPKVLLDLAQCYRGLGVREEALKFYRSYLRKVPDAANRDDVQRVIEKLESGTAAAAPARPPVAPAPAPPPPRASSPPAGDGRFVPPDVRWTDTTDDATTRRARAAFEVGMNHLRTRDYYPAISAFEAGYSTKPLPVFLIKLAECNFFTGRFASAARALDAYMDELDDALAAADRARYEALVANWKARAANAPRPVAVRPPPQQSQGQAIINVYRPNNMLGAWVSGKVVITGADFSRTFKLRNNKFVVTTLPAGDYTVAVNGMYEKLIANLSIDAATDTTTYVRCEFHKTCNVMPETEGRADAARCKENVKGD